MLTVVHEKKESAGFAEMGLDEEKTVLGEEIVSEQDEDSDPEDEGDEEEAPGDDGGDGDDDDDEDEEELEDPLEKVRDACGERAECTKFKTELDLCNQRVSNRSNTEETCVQELFDFLECQDKCIGHHLFSKLK